MNSLEFVNAIKIAVEESSLEDMISNLENPPGRKPSEKLLELSEWFNSLETKDREYLKEIIRLSIKNTIFGMLCVLDGVRQIEDTYEKGELILEFHKNEEIERINDPTGDYLHDIYNAE